MCYKKVIFGILYYGLLFVVYGQKGTISGTIFDQSTGEPMLAVTAVIKGTTHGAVTGLDGAFEILVPAGTYDIQASFVSYSNVIVTGIEVKPGETTQLVPIEMSEDITILDEIYITAEVVKTTETALLSFKRKSPVLLDGISSANFRKIGDVNAAAAARRIIGVSIDQGRYVYVRGLGDRYTKTMLNGIDVPGLDPDRNTLQMDLFPTQILDNIIVVKSAAAQYPEDFTGGLVNIETKDVPDEKIMNFTLGFGYNPSMHFNKEYLTYAGGSTDFLGFDDGTRKLPIADQDIILNGHISTGEQQKKYAAQLKDFNKTIAAQQKTSFMDYNLGYTLGNRLDTKLGTLGYHVALTYRNTTQYFDDVQYSRYGIVDRDPTVMDLEQRELQVGELGIHNVLLGGLAGIALKRNESNYKFNFLRLQNGESRSGVFNYTGNDEGADFYAVQHNLEYSQKTLTNFFLSGEHYINQNDWVLKWKIAPTFSVIVDPDIRFTRYQTNASFNGDYGIGSGEAGFPQRIWRDLNEINWSGNFNIDRNYVLFGRESKMKFGISYAYKRRNYVIKPFQIIVQNDENLTGNPDEIFYDDRLFPNKGGNYYQPTYVPINSNAFESSMGNQAVYWSGDISLFKHLNANFGLRAVRFVQRYTGINTQRINLENEMVIDEFDLFPNVNLKYAFRGNQNLRMTYFRSAARFSFKEASFAEIFDPLTGRTFLGALSPLAGSTRNPDGSLIYTWNGDITSTRIDNFDLRWELFKQKGQTVSIGGFYKAFSDAIETVQSAVADNSFQPRNVGDATVFGTEIEIRHRLDFISQRLVPWMISTNLTFLRSRIQMTDEEYNSRLSSAREGQIIENRRSLQGQSPFIINGGISYNAPKNNLEMGLYYNLQGPTLTFTGIADLPDVYSVPFHSLNFTMNKQLGAKQQWNIGLKAVNLLNNKRELVYKNFGSVDRTFQRLNPNTKISLNITYSL